MPSFAMAVADLRSLGPVLERLIAVIEPVEAVLRTTGRPVPPPTRRDASGTATAVDRIGILNRDFAECGSTRFWLTVVRASGAAGRGCRQRC